ncbi:MAG: metallophosphoesterase family protein [Anaerolineales bacterium]|jgi:putative phosphoesterase
MKLAFFSDIHANIHALQAVWNDIEAQAPDAVYCLGDLVGYGAYPNEVIDFLRQRQVPTLMGNYDEGVGFDMDDCGCAYREPEQEALGHQSLLWTREQTRAENKAYLRSLPLQIRLEEHRPSMLLVHGSPRRINEYLFEDRPEASFERLAKLAGTQVLLFGHTHIPYQKAIHGTLFVNTGSVGKPKDGDSRAGYVLLSTGPRPGVEFRRVEYDLQAAAGGIRSSGLPVEFARQLESGGVIEDRETLGSEHRRAV